MNSRRTARVAATCVAVGIALSQVVPASGATLPPARAGAPAADSPMRQLDFMIGRWKCVNTVSVPGKPPVENTLLTDIFPTLDGAWLQWNAVQAEAPENPLKAHWTGGWNAQQNQFVSFYSDNRGNYANGTSPGLADGHMPFVGTIVSSGPTPVADKDDFVPVSRHQFDDVYSVQVNGQWVVAAVSHCTRR